MNYIETLKLKYNVSSYEDIIKAGIKDNINDEITAMVLYFLFANKLQGKGTPNISKELIEHGTEEGTSHYKELLEYAALHGFINEIKPQLTEDMKYVTLTDTEEIVKVTQELEKTARKKYLELAKFAKENEDIKSESFFLEIANDEEEHFKDLSYVNGDTIKVGEKFEGNLLKSILAEKLI